MSRGMRNLRPITGEGNTKEVRFITFDIEAESWINHVCSGLYDLAMDKFIYKDNLDEMLEVTMDYCINNSVDNVFAHNGGKYDFNFMLQSFLFNKKYIVSGMIPRGSGILCFTVQEREPKRIEDGEGYKVTFRDSLALLPFGLAKLAKAMGVKVQKGNIDYDFIGEIWRKEDYRKKVISQPEKYKVYNKTKKDFKYKNLEAGTTHTLYTQKDLIVYLKDDLVSLAQCIQHFYDWELVRKAGSSFTTAGQAVKIFQTFIKHPVYKLGQTSDDFIRKGYFGGRTEVFKPIFDSSYDLKNNPENFSKEALKVLKRQSGKVLNYYDVNSLYPTVMRDNIFPNRCDGWCYEYDPKKLGFWECLVDVPEDHFFPFLGTKHDIDGTEKLIFPTGEFKGIWTTAEIEYAKKIGVKIKYVYRGITFKSGGKMFKEFIQTLYDMRLEAKAKGDGVNDLLTKLMMNSCYGKFGMNVNREGLTLDTGAEGLKIHSEIINPKTGETVRLMSEKVNLDSSFTNVAISAYVTAYSRILMHKIYLKSGAQNTYYTDTDSIFTSKLFKTGDKLGELKLEYTTKSAVFLLPKTYINEGVEGESFEKKVTMKGFDRKKIKHFTAEDFRNQLRGEVDSLMVNQEAKFATLRTALSKGHFLCMNFDAETNIKVDEKKLKADEKLLAEHEEVLSLNDDPEIVADYTDKIKRLKGKISGRKRKLKKHNYHESKRSIKSQYDKRKIVLEGFDSSPIHLEA